MKHYSVTKKGVRWLEDKFCPLTLSASENPDSYRENTPSSILIFRGSFVFESAPELKNAIAQPNVVRCTTFDVPLNPLFEAETTEQKEPTRPSQC
jgi:hypothetical protein